MTDAASITRVWRWKGNRRTVVAGALGAAAAAGLPGLVRAQTGATPVASPVAAGAAPYLLVADRDEARLYVYAIPSFERPAAVGQLVESLPTALRGLRSGKVTPRKALLHPKLPDQRKVRRIVKTIESRDERLELNLYIVGESGEEEQGVMAEGSLEGLER